MLKDIILVGDNKIASESKALVNSWAKNDKRTHIYLLSELSHIEKYGDPRRLNAFFEALKEAKGTAANKVRAMRAFVLHFGNVEMAGGKLDMKRVRDEEDKRTSVVVKRSEAEFKAAMDKAAATSWTNFKEPTERAEFNLHKVVLGMLTRVLVETNNTVTIEEIEAEIERVAAEAKIEAAKRIKRAEIIKAVEAASAEPETATQKLRAVK